jgi:hypothetical protein
VWLVSAVLVASVWGAGRALGGTEPGRAGSTKVYLVREGDTLWAIARDRVGPEGDPRPLVQEIRQLNGLATSAITAGQTLRLP